MKGKSFFSVVLCFVPAVAACAVLSGGFRKFSAVCFLLYTLLVAALFLLLWFRRVEKPAGELLAAITRAGNGDYGARFYCRGKNGNFQKLSCSFNRLIQNVEIQTKDLDENRLHLKSLYEDEKLYRAALELICERVFEADLIHNRLLYGRETYEKAFPFFCAQNFDEMVRSVAQNAVEEKDAETFLHTFSRSSLIKAFYSHQKNEVTLEYRQKKAGGGTFWVGTTVIFLSGERDASLKIIGFVKNIDSRKRSELKVLKQSRKDGMTGLYHKKFTQTLMEDFLRKEGRKSRHAVIMVDIDNFKRINDTCGHLQGDAALVSVAQKLSGIFRSTDIVGRFGGDEFFILMKDCQSNETLWEKLEEVSGMLESIPLKNSGLHISGSIGAAIYPEDGTCFSDLCQKADTALYYSKSHGKNRYCLYSNFLKEQGKTSLPQNAFRKAPNSPRPPCR